MAVNVDAFNADTFNADALIALGRVLQQQDYQFTTVTPATHALVNARAGNDWAVDMRGVFGWSRPFREEVLPAAMIELMRRAGVIVAHGQDWRSLVRASSLHGQLFFHSAFPTDASDAVFFGPDTYRYADAIKRQLARSAPALRRAVDIGCGAGPGAILMARECPDAEVFATDINAAALHLTRANAMLAGASNVTTLHGDLLHDMEGQFDLITANPPYLLDATERTYRHGGGAHGEGLSLAIVEQAIQRLAPGGTLLLYTGVAIVNGRDVFKEAACAKLPTGMDWDYAELDPDVFGEELSLPAYQDVERIAAVLLTVRAGR